MTYQAQYCDKNARTELKYIKQYNDNLGNEECYYENMLRELAEFLEHPNFMGLNDDDHDEPRGIIYTFNKIFKEVICALSELLGHDKCEIIYNHLMELLDNAHNSPDSTDDDYLKGLAKIMIIMKNLSLDVKSKCEIQIEFN